VSIDGPENLNGARKNANGGDPFQKSLAGFRKLQNAGVSPVISCTLNQFNAGHVEEITEFISRDLKAQRARIGKGF
jgi:sulfatase maturation enzyme AslB (radical SAM superfamily)